MADVDTIVNSSTVNSVNVVASYKPATFSNTSTINNVSVTREIDPVSIGNANLIGGIFRVIPGQVSPDLETITNTSTVNDLNAIQVFKPVTIVNVSEWGLPQFPYDQFVDTTTISNTNSLGSIIVKKFTPDSGPIQPGNNIQRPATNRISSTETLQDGKIGEKGAVYKDLSNSFKAHPLTGAPVKLLNYASVTQALKNLLLTLPGERYFENIDLGSPIRNKLFDLFTPTLKRELEEDITQAILNYEPRVIVIAVDVQDDPKNYGLNISITYKIRTFERVESFNLFLERI